MNPRARGRGLFSRGIGVSGRTSIFFHNENTTLYRSAPRTWTLPRIAHRCSNDSSRISPGFRPETPPRLSRQLQRTTLKPAAFFKNATAAISGKSDDTGAALSPTKVDIIVVGKRKVEVPRGRPFSERVWTECNNGNRRVMFSPNVEAKLVPSKEDCYPTARYKAACFFSEYHADVEKMRVAPGGKDQAEWLVLLSETRQVAAEGRKKQLEQQLLPTDPGVARQGNSRLDQRDEKNGIQTGNGGCVAGSSVSEASMVPETKPLGTCRFNVFPVGGGDEKRGVFKAAKTFGGWIKKLYRVSWTPHKSGVDSCFDWVVDSPAGSQYNIV